MALIQCAECSKEISDKAVNCPHCGAPKSQPIAVQRSKPGLVILVIVLVVVAIIGIISLGSSGSGDKAVSDSIASDLCAQSAEAAHYIAAKSGNSGDVTQVTDDVIADQKYPALGDKVTASIGAMVALSRDTDTPDEISAKVRTTCENAAAQH